MARIKWIQVVNRDDNLLRDFENWRSHRRFKIKSVNRLAYIFLRSKYGLDWLNWQRHHFKSDEEIIRILKTKWIKVDGELI